MDEETFNQLKESKHSFPEITEVIYNYDQMLELSFHSITIAEKGYDSVWDQIVFDRVWNDFQEGLQVLKKQIELKGLMFRVITEVTEKNIDRISSLHEFNIKHLDNIRGNFGIFDDKAYMVQIFQNEKQHLQTFYSNSKIFVKAQQRLFNKLWRISTPISFRKEELKHQSIVIDGRIIKDYDEIKHEINMIIRSSKKSLLILTSLKLIYELIGKDQITEKIIVLLKRNVYINILVDRADKNMHNQINKINKKNHNNLFHFLYSAKLGGIHDMMIISDDRYLIQIRYDQNETIVAIFSNDEHKILVQEILFEKYWNEIQSLTIKQTNRQ